MKVSRIAILAAMWLPVLSSGARAEDYDILVPGTCFEGACVQAAGQRYQDENGDDFNVLNRATFPGIAVTAPAPALAMHDHDSDPATPDVPLTVDHDNDPSTPNVQAYVDNGAADGLSARAHGHNSAAIGAGSRVGAYVYDEDGNQVFWDPQGKYPKTTPVENGTAIGANSHVSHNNSTAVGAGAKSTDTNQVTLGTKDETIRAEGITSQKSKDRQIGPREVVTSDSGGRLATDGGEIFSRLGGLESGVSANAAAITANTALLSEHSARLDEQAKGLAIAMAMPDAWLSDKKRFGVFGAVGGFGDETALGFAAIGRIDETWSLNAKVGSDTSFDEFGWQVGVGAQW